MSRRYRPADPATLPDLVAGLLQAAPPPGVALRVAIDGPACVAPAAFADALVAPLRALGRPAVTIRAETFWRDASLRLEHGREDVDSYLGWLDSAALRREVLDPLGAGGSGRYLPSLRDPATDRATREPARPGAGGTIVMVAGELLLGLALPFDVTIHLTVSPAARWRRTAPAAAWTLEALDRYDEQVRPADIADVAIRYDDPAHPAISA
jgi:hypothetical protein